MGWHELMEELERKVIGTLEGIYRPQDGIPFFRLQYPPKEEREAIRQLHLFAERLKQRGWQAECLSLTEVLKGTLSDLLNCTEDELFSRLRDFEQGGERDELRERLSEALSKSLPERLVGRLHPLPQQSVVVLLRTGALYPFLRPSVLLSHLENQVRCVIVLAYPATSVGELLDAPPSGSHGGYYRGEVVVWQ